MRQLPSSLSSEAVCGRGPGEARVLPNVGSSECISEILGIAPFTDSPSHLLNRHLGGWNETTPILAWFLWCEESEPW